MSTASSEIDPAVEPQVVVEESSSAAGGSREEEAPPEAAAAVEAPPKQIETEPAAEEEEGECGFCLYMKDGGCKEAFVSWEECVDAAEKEGSDMVARCSQATADLKKCMDAHADYYAPVLKAEQTVSGQAEAAVAAAATADTNENQGEESAPSPDTDETKVEEAVVQPAAAANVDEQPTSSTAAEEVKEEEAIVHKPESMI